MDINIKEGRKHCIKFEDVYEGNFFISNKELFLKVYGSFDHIYNAVRVRDGLPVRFPDCQQVDDCKIKIDVSYVYE